MKVTGVYHPGASNQVIIEIEFEPNQHLANFALEMLEANEQLHTTLANYLAASVATLRSLPPPVVFMTIQLITEALHESLNTGIALAERVEAGENPDEIYNDFVYRRSAEAVGDMVETENVDAFDDFIEGGLNFKPLEDSDGPDFPEEA